MLSLGVVLLAALALAGCGRKGPLELPPGAPPESAAKSAAIEDRVLGNQDHPGTVQNPNKAVTAPASSQAAAAKPPAAGTAEGEVPRPINAPPQAKTGFFLDPLL